MSVILTIGAVAKGVMAVADAVPYFDKWLQQFVAFYIQRKIAKMEKEQVEAIKVIINENDQRLLEKAIGSPTAGAPSPIQNGVKKRKRRGNATVLSLLLLVLFLPACKEIQRKIEAELYLNDSLPAEICGEKPGEGVEAPLDSPWAYGIFRVINCNKEALAEGLCTELCEGSCKGPGQSYEDYISFCDPAIKEYVAINKVRLKNIFDATIPKTEAVSKSPKRR